MDWKSQATAIGVGAGLATGQSSYDAFKHSPKIQNIEERVRKIADKSGEPFSKVNRAVEKGYNSVE
jgi:hypothetical protein